MRLRRRKIDKNSVAEVEFEGAWKRLSGTPETTAMLDGREAADLLPYLKMDPAELRDLAPRLPDANPATGGALTPVEPRSFRDFMLHEKHVIDASRGMVRRLMPKVFPITRIFERVTGEPFPKFKPHRLWYRQPIYYLGNHLNMLTDGDVMPWPAYANLLDYELEIGAILARPLRDASPEEAAKAIGGFVVLNDFSARDVQIDEMRSGFGPQKAKHFASAMSAEVVLADEVSPRLGELQGSVRINGVEVATCSSSGGHFTLPEAIAFASKGEQLHPGELFGSGTLPGGAGVENGALVSPGDELTLEIEGVGSLTNHVGAKGL